MVYDDQEDQEYYILSLERWCGSSGEQGSSGNSCSSHKDSIRRDFHYDDDMFKTLVIHKWYIDVFHHDDASLDKREYECL